ncbi:MAG: bifunctional demethylmenaquinone methyltransferase/2-methoxy-6-polyprenyl-1,4-benzoquinol methylase UbiE [Bacteroidetes bacterium]|nr:bifunctional demethylmenaquinone methyltransferase/2-methoxy-6-polyprenyl-1,4-benzoquinol methylase UbiE [Bacteroidota bacterium]
MQVKPEIFSTETQKVQIKKMFDSISHKYDFLNHTLSLGIDKIWRKKAINSLRNIKPKRIIDIATGTGDMAIEAIKLNPEKIIGIDISSGMLEIGRKKIKAKNINNIELLYGDSEKIDFADNTFDAATVAFGVRNFENLEKGLSEIYRVLKNGGMLAILEFSKPTIFPVKQLYNFYFNVILPKIGNIFSKNKFAYKYLPDSVMKFPDGSNFLNIMKNCGYENCTQKRLMFGICTLYNGSK